MAGNLVQDGSTIDLPIGTAYTAGSLYQISAGVGSIVGVALETTTTAQIPTFAVEGVWDLATTTGATNVFSAGDVVYATTGAGALTLLNNTTAGDIMVGTAWETIIASDTTLKVKLNVGQKIA